ncbi:MAG TPA: hydroxyacylglutathione hydrolase [Xanthomonadaceae bacterium]|nr:hydroxyacylglutathione hydrolase [Xanthomonadaceae bacterium]
MKLRAIEAFADNYIWALADAQGLAVIVDPGDSAPVFEAIGSGLQPVAILLTHHHPDHIGGAEQLLQRFDVPCYAPVDPRIGCATHRVGSGDSFTIPEFGLQFATLEVHGHTSSHVAFFGHGIVFCGDTLFSLGCGRMFEGTPQQMLASLDRLAALPHDTRVCCGHEYTLSNGAFASVIEPENLALQDRLREARASRDEGQPSVPSTLASELACNPFLRVDTPSVRATVEQHLGEPCGDRVQTFAALRRWKDGFRA